MKVKELIKCPLCNFAKNSDILALNCGNFDSSALYQSVKIVVCKECGHIYNKLSSNEIIRLRRYYNKEYAPVNIGSTNKTGDRPGSNNQNTLGRYKQLYSLITKHINSEFKVLDIGCAMGGFLEYLYANGIKNLFGIDTTLKYVNYAKHKGNCHIKVGSAESIPFDDSSFNLLVMDQVLEHLVDPVKAFREAKRVLVEGGLFCIGVPDALRYQKTYFFDFFWFLMREHIQHFDLAHLKLLAGRAGFELLGFSESETPMMSAKMILPNLNVLFRLTGRGNKGEIREDCFRLGKEIGRYVTGELDRLKNKKAFVNGLVKSQRPVYAWGIGREFLYFYEASGLKHCNIVGLIDSNPYKQANFMVDGLTIRSKTILNEATPDSLLIITAIAHSNAIQKELIKVGYQGEIFTP